MVYPIWLDVTAAIAVGDFTFKAKRDAAGGFESAGKFNIQPQAFMIGTATTTALKRVVMSVGGITIDTWWQANVIHHGMHIDGFTKANTTTDTIIIFGAYAL